jgi:transposase
MTSYVGIDVAKRQHKVAMMGEDGQLKTRPYAISNDLEGFEALQGRLAELAEPLEMGLEATGHYWLALFDYLTQAGYTVHVLNPLQVHAYQRSGIRKRKTDKIDAIWIADFVRIGGARTRVEPDTLQTYLQLRQLARFRMSLVDQIGDAKRRILGVLDRIFPEYERLFSNVFMTTSRQLLAEAVTPQEFADFDLDELTQLLKQASRGRLGRDKAEQIQNAARRSIGVTFLADAARVQLGCLLAQITFIEQQVAEVDSALEDLVAALPDQYLTTIPGIGPVTAATILGEIGDIHRFSSIEKLVAYAGIDPTIYESGQFQAREAHMSKRGSPHLRHALWMAASVARQHDPELRAYFEKRRAEGKAYGVVMGAICRKLLNRIYVVLREQHPYIVH